VAEAPEEDIKEPVPAEEDEGLGHRLRRRLDGRGPLVIAIVASVASLALLCLFGYLLLRGDGDGAEEQATPTAESEDEQVDVNTDTFEYQSISDTSAITLTMETPIFLDVAGEEFTVQAEVLPESGPWSPPTVNETTAAWVYGAVINYVFGLDDNDQNRELLENLIVGEELALTTRSGATMEFVVSERRSVDSEDQEIFAQREPSITLLLIEEDVEDERPMVKGRYVVPDTSDDVPAGRVVELGETAQLETLQITVNGVNLVYDRPEAPAGFAIFQIDYQAQNVGPEAVSSNTLSMVLADDLGNLYALNPIASQLGNNPPLSGSIGPGQTIAATAGYQIPAGLSSSVLRWQVSFVGTGSQIQVNLPFQNSTESQQQVEVQVQEATVSQDGGSLLVVGQITNISEETVVVDVEDVTLVGASGTVFLKLSTNPAFPWTIPQGQTLLFGVTFQRPLGSEATFSILNQSFQLSGIR
jgi:hypothetical protein